jgi:hypothetical protein
MPRCLLATKSLQMAKPFGGFFTSSAGSGVE